MKEPGEGLGAGMGCAHSPGGCRGSEGACFAGDPEEFARDLIGKALAFGADLAGFASIQDLKYGPSEMLFPRMKDHARDHFAGQITTGLAHGAVKWEEDAKSVLVFAVRHPREKPEMDWWCGEIDPPGNKLLAQIAKKLKAYAEETYPGVCVYKKPYHVEKGGIYLKDAAVAAGLGCIGKNNLLVTPEYGPRIRLRALTLNVPVLSSGPLDFDPCRSCGAPCVANCPQQAFSRVIYTQEETGLACLPARGGNYYRKACACEMERNEKDAPLELVPEYPSGPMPVIRYCRNCELACTAGK